MHMAGAVLAWRIREINWLFSEAKNIALSLYNVFFIVLVVFTLVLALNVGTLASSLIMCFGIIFCTIGSVGPPLFCV